MTTTVIVLQRLHPGEIDSAPLVFRTAAEAVAFAFAGASPAWAEREATVLAELMAYGAAKHDAGTHIALFSTAVLK